MAQQQLEVTVVPQEEGEVVPTHMFPSSSLHCAEEFVAVTPGSYATKRTKQCAAQPQPRASPFTTNCNPAPLVNGQPVGNVSQDIMASKIGANMSVVPSAQQQIGCASDGGNTRGYVPQTNNPTGSEQFMENVKGINYYDQQNQKIKTVFMSSHFSAADADANPDVASVRVQSGNVFGCKVAVPEPNTKNPLEPLWRKVAANLKTAVLTGVYLISAKNEHPYPLVASLTGVRGNTYTVFGGNYSFPMHSCSMNTYGGKGLSIFKRKKMDETYMSIYGGLTEDSILLGIFAVPGVPDFVFVMPNHAIIRVLKMNSDMIDLRRVRRTYRGMYEMKRAFVNTMIENIVEKALKKLPYVDLNECVVRFMRADVKPEGGKPHFTNPTGALRAAEDDAPLMKYYTTTAFGVELVLKFVYFVSSAL